MATALTDEARRRERLVAQLKREKDRLSLNDGDLTRVVSEQAGFPVRLGNIRTWVEGKNLPTGVRVGAIEKAISFLHDIEVGQPVFASPLGAKLRPALRVVSEQERGARETLFAVFDLLLVDVLGTLTVAQLIALQQRVVTAIADRSKEVE